MNKLFFFIHICLILILAHATAGTLYKAILPGEIFVETRMENKSLVPRNAGKKTEKKEAGNTLGNPDGVIARNLFQVVTDAPVAVEDPSEPKGLDDLDLQPTRLELALWGTVTGPDFLFAVIEDKHQRRQALYGKGDEVQGAKIKKILRNGVVLTLNGEDQLLEMEEESRSFDMVRERRTVGNGFQKGFIRPRPMEEFPDKGRMPQGKQPVKFRPHFMENRMDGVILYGIHSASPFRSLGLRNGDIVTFVDENDITALENTDQLIEDLTKPGTTTIRFLRGGQERQIVYTNENGKYRVSSLHSDEP